MRSNLSSKRQWTLCYLTKLTIQQRFRTGLIKGLSRYYRCYRKRQKDSSSLSLARLCKEREQGCIRPPRAYGTRRPIIAALTNGVMTRCTLSYRFLLFDVSGYLPNVGDYICNGQNIRIFGFI